ncbi:MAG: biopolymer transporter ExbD [Deltaproteobacteria bacterium]|nr:biopolymer transporter ExbD [Deltaproteobacteria bacterium]MBW2020124.1 biopolymer transporter ExbD [Deltaproteobacteria bacterium]MBW2074977.1 biopolymer transporter ExbD [Deltaproteobacteria bacterium]
MKLRIKQKSARIELIPLIDIIFLLLVFFIYSMLSMAVYRGIPVMLPSAETVENAKEQAVFITVDKKGNVFVDKESIDRDELLARLKRERAAFPQKVAIISGDGDSPYRVFVDVLDKARLAGFQKVSIEASPKKNQQQ